MKQPTVVAIVAGLLYAWSPLTVIGLIIIALLVRCARAGLEAQERTWVSRLFVTAAALRVLCIAGVFAATTQTTYQYNALFGDGRFAIDRSLSIVNLASNTPLPPFSWQKVYENYGDIRYHQVLAVIQWLTVPSPYAVAVLNVAAFVGFGVVFHRLTRAAFGRATALVTIGILLFWPTIFVWSFSTLKEPVQFLLAAIVIQVGTGVIQHRFVLRPLLVIVGGASMFLLTNLRSGGAVIAACALAGGGLLRFGTRRVWTSAVLLAVVVAAGYAATTSPTVQERVLFELRMALVRHLGHVHSQGVSYRAADGRFYSEGREAPWSETYAEGIRFVSRSVAEFWVAPLPSEVQTRAGWALVPTTVFWYVLVGLAVAGLPWAIRRDALVAWTFVAYIVAAVAVISPNSGNIGTLVRHRDMVVPFVAAFGSIGLIRIVTFLTRPTDAPSCAVAHTCR